MHIKALKDSATQFNIDIQSNSALEHELQEDDASAGIREARTRIEMKAKLPVGFERG
ncbi:MAG TPA: hypothetical protein VFP68_04505 [Burkholderiaceae bacterium]|nr:hypothetical protein [Burkholderiaceae bacterium]